MHLYLGSERDAVYPFLDFTKDYDLAVKYVLGMTFGAQSGTILKSNYGMKLSDTLVIDRTTFNIVLKFYSALFLYSKNWNFGFGKKKNGSIQYEKYCRESNTESNSGFESVTKEFVNTEYEHSFASLPQSDK